jgi:hypothetical protein
MSGGRELGEVAIRHIGSLETEAREARTSETGKGTELARDCS